VRKFLATLEMTTTTGGKKWGNIGGKAADITSPLLAAASFRTQ
jgi:hypothetical protein